MRQQRALAALGTFALHSDDLQQVLEAAARLCAEGTGVPYCKIVEHRPESGDMMVRAGFGWREGVLGRVLPADRSTPVGRAWARAEPVITNDLRLRHDFRLPSLYAEYRIVSSANVVIENFGVLEIDSPRRRSFGERDVVFLVGFANICAETVARLQRQRTLQQLVSERGTFLRELQHRVRNHLHLLVAQAQLLARRTRDDEARRGFEEIVERLMALATLYDRLLGVRMAPRLDLGGYLRALCENIRAFEAPEQRGVALACDVESVEASLETATSLGIIANELVANSLEHAFAAEGGQIELVLRRVEPGRLRLTIADNGTGMPSRPQGLGLNLVRRLARQLGGALKLRHGGGTCWEIDLPAG